MAMTETEVTTDAEVATAAVSVATVTMARWRGRLRRPPLQCYNFGTPPLRREASSGCSKTLVSADVDGASTIQGQRNRCST